MSAAHTMRVALAQLDSRLGDLAANRERAREVIAQARAGGADLVVFPELSLSGYAVGHTDRETACTVDELAPLATDAFGAAVLVGFHEWSAGRTYNSAAYFERGRLVHLHRKLYLPRTVSDESLVFTPGERMNTFDASFGRAAALICNDAWQPVLPFLAAHEGARVLLVPVCSSTAVPEAESVWHDLTRLYARLLQCYVVFCNRVGEEAGLTFWGGSHVVDPYGELVAEAARFREELLFAEIEPDLVERRRRELPLLGDPRFDLLGAECERLEASWQRPREVVRLPVTGTDAAGLVDFDTLF